MPLEVCEPLEINVKPETRTKLAAVAVMARAELLVPSVMTVEPMPLPIRVSAFPLIVTGVDQVADPAGTTTVSPLLAALIAACTAADEVLAAVTVAPKDRLVRTIVKEMKTKKPNNVLVWLNCSIAFIISIKSATFALVWPQGLS
jgi:hypothetical protein